MGTAPPNVFGPFRVLHQVGAGVLGPVFRAYDPDRDRLVAIKVFHLDLAPDRVHRLVAELETILAAGLTHPVIARPIAVGIEGVHAYLVQDYVAAESLDTVVREHGPTPAENAVRVAAHVAEALDAAAAAGIMHGALHPRDLLLSTDQTRLTGLGVAQALEAVGAAAPIRRPYTAPERASGAAWHHSADIFSLAALIHELLWGRRIAATGREAALSLTESAGGDLLELQEAFACALAENPEERFATAGQFADALKGAFSRQSAVGSRQSAVGGQQSRLGLPTAHRRLPTELRLPLDDGIAISSAFQPPTPSAETFAERFTDIDLTPEPAFTLRESAVDSYQSPVSSLQSDDIDDQPPSHQPLATSHQPLATSHRSRWPLWPVALALVAGGVVGSGVGYAVGTRMFRSPPASTASTTSPPAAAPSPSSTVRLKPDTTNTTTPPTANAAAPKPAIAAAAPPAAAATTPFVAPTGRLVVRSTPVGARVFVDGKDVGRTPVTVRDLARGSHRVRLTHDGYTTTERRVSITTDQLSRSMTVRLERARAGSAQ